MYSRYKFTNAAAIVVAAALTVAGCGRKGDAVEMGPAETVVGFCRAVAGGDFETAESLCDTTTMNAYIRDYAAALEMQVKADSCVARIAAGMVAKAEISVDEVMKEGDRRIVHYTVKVSEDITKTKTARVKKEEGAWKVEAITDRN